MQRNYTCNHFKIADICFQVFNVLLNKYYFCFSIKGCCRLFRSFPPEDYEPIATSTETTFSKTVVPSSGEKQPLKNNEKKSSKTNVNNIPQAEEAKEDSLPFEQDLLFNTVLVNSKIKYAAIATFPDGTVKAANFPVRKKGIQINYIFKYFQSIFFILVI